VYESNFGKKLANDASKMLALSEFEATQYIHGGIKPDKIAVIPNGVNPEDFSNFSSTNVFKKSFGIGNEEVVLYLGRLHRDKGIDTLVKAFAALSKKKTSIKLMVAGPDDGYLGTLKNMVKALNLTDKVLFTGSLNRRQVLAAYNCASVVVYVSAQEGFPLVPLEAGVMGKPMIVSEAPGLDFVRKGNFGVTVKYGNVSQLEEALETILNNPAFSMEMGKNGKKFVLDNYAWDTIGKKIEDIYYSISR
jgi:glycosyltransferase involved in cell wall biosynthesis